MKHNSQHRIFSILILILASLLAVSSSIGLFSKDFYVAETLNWQTQAIGQDMVDLFLVTPALLLFAFLYIKGKNLSLSICAGTLLYIVYTFVIYAFAVHFNSLFIIYCLILGLSFYSFCYTIWIAIPQKRKVAMLSAAMKYTAIYFLIVAILFYILWLTQIIPPTLRNTVPQELHDIGLLTNPVHVIDLSVCLPGIFLAGIFILRKKPIGFFIGPSILTFMILMDITIGFLAWLMKERGIAEEATMAYVMLAFAMISIFLLVRISRTSFQS